MKRPALFFFLAAFLFSASGAYAFSGTEAASFLDIPVGGRPASLGGAYSALASDAYAPVWNPGGLSLSPTNELTGMHLSYLEDISYEFLSFAHALGDRQALGGAVQYLRPGSTVGTDINGNSIGDIHGYYAAYTAAYGFRLREGLGLGVSGKFIHARISDVDASAYGFDAGLLARPSDRLRLSAVVSNLGTPLQFLSQRDPLPMNFRLGAAYQILSSFLLSTEGIYSRSGQWAGRVGSEWGPISLVSLRAGFRTDTLRQLSPLAGFSTGLGLHRWEQELDYAWVPMGDLGDTQYFSLVIRFGKTGRQRDLIAYHSLRHGEKLETTDPYRLDGEFTPFVDGPVTTLKTIPTETPR